MRHSSRIIRGESLEEEEEEFSRRQIGIAFPFDDPMAGWTISDRCVDLYDGYTLSHVDDTVFYKDTPRR